MKKALLLLILFTAQFSFADIISVNGRELNVDMSQVKRNSVVFHYESTKYQVPMAEVEFIFIDEDNPRATQLQNKLQKYHSGDPCQQGKLDASLRGKSVINVVGGIFFGPLALIHKSIKSYHPRKDYHKTGEARRLGYYDNAEYLYCYQTRARRDAVVATLVGWASWVLLFSGE